MRISFRQEQPSALNHSRDALAPALAGLILGMSCTGLAVSGTVVGWGGGQIPTPSGLNDIVAISASVDHVLALRSDGTVVSWGSDPDGQCDVPAGLTNVTNVAAG